MVHPPPEEQELEARLEVLEAIAEASKDFLAICNKRLLLGRELDPVETLKHQRLEGLIRLWEDPSSRP